MLHSVYQWHSNHRNTLTGTRILRLCSRFQGVCTRCPVNRNLIKFHSQTQHQLSNLILFTNSNVCCVSCCFHHVKHVTLSQPPSFGTHSKRDNKWVACYQRNVLASSRYFSFPCFISHRMQFVSIMSNIFRINSHLPGECSACHWHQFFSLRHQRETTFFGI